MVFENFGEFWAALNRLYESTVKLEERQARTDEQIDKLTDRLDRTVSMVATLAGAVTKLTRDVEMHERRLERLEGP